MDISVKDRYDLWHDDIKRPPAGFDFWARTNEIAKKYIEMNPIRHISMDHDLGGHNLDPDAPETWLYKGPSDHETGLDLARWMVKMNCVPSYVTIHSWNPDGARRMMEVLQESDALVRIKPYERPT